MVWSGLAEERSDWQSLIERSPIEKSEMSDWPDTLIPNGLSGLLSVSLYIGRSSCSSSFIMRSCTIYEPIFNRNLLKKWISGRIATQISPLRALNTVFNEKTL